MGRSRRRVLAHQLQEIISQLSQLSPPGDGVGGSGCSLERVDWGNPGSEATPGLPADFLLYLRHRGRPVSSFLC